MTGLLRQFSDDAWRLVHDEFGLAKAEMSSRARSAGIGAGLFSELRESSRSLGWAPLIATAVIAFSLAVDAGLAALIVTVVVFAAAATATLRPRQHGARYDS